MQVRSTYYIQQPDVDAVMGMYIDADAFKLLHSAVWVSLFFPNRGMGF